MAEENKIILDADVKPLRLQLKDATQQLQVARQKFGEFSNEAVQSAQKVAAIRDEIDAANEAAQLFDPGKRFQALTTAASTAAGGIAAVQGAMALFGNESEDVAKTLQKVQGAMALSQGLSQLKDISKVTEGLKLSFQGLTAGANGLKKALISTGIGALVVAVGLLVVYWEDIMALVGGVSKEQNKLNEATLKDLEANKEKLDAIDGQANQLKLQGKSEADILEMKIAQTNEAIKSAEINLQNAQATKKAQVDAAQRNKDILQGIIRFISLPITTLLATIDGVGKALGKDFGLEEGFSGGLANMVFDPKEMSDKGNETIKEAESQLNQLKEKQAGFQLSQQEAEKTAGEKAKAERDKQNQKELEARKILEDAKTKMLDKQKQEEKAIENTYAEQFKKLKEAGIKDDGSLEIAKQEDLKEIRNKYQKEQEEKDRSFEKSLNEMRTQTRLDGIRDENERARQEILIDFEKRRQDIINDEKLNSAQKTALKLELGQQEQQSLIALDNSIKEQEAARQMADLDIQIKEAEFEFNIQRDLVDKKLALAEEEYTSGRMKEAEYTAFLKANADERTAIDQAQVQAKMQVAQQVAGILSSMSDLAGKDTAAGKGLAIAAATINTYTGATQALNSKVPAPEPLATIIRVAQAGVIVASGIKSIREIAKTKVPSGGGSSAPSISASAPQVASQVPTLGNSPVTSLQNIMDNQKPLKAYVVESEVTGSQKRVADIERRAGF